MFLIEMWMNLCSSLSDNWEDVNIKQFHTLNSFTIFTCMRPYIEKPEFDNLFQTSVTLTKVLNYSLLLYCNNFVESLS
jgi:hypothetical protein